MIFFAAFDCRRPAGSVPLWELEFHAWDAMSGKHVILGHEFERLSPAEQERACHTNAEILLSVSEKLDYAAVTAPSSYWEQAPGQLAYYVLPGEARFRQIEILTKLAGDKVAIAAGTGGIMGADYSEEFCDKLYNEPDSLDAYARGCLEGGVAAAKRMRDLGVKIVFSASDMADNSGPFFSPDQMQRFILPHLDEWGHRCREMGLRSVLHSDGNLTRYLDAIAATRIDALQAIDPVAGMDIRESFKVAAGRLCLCGNVDCGLLLRGTPDEVYASAKSLIEEGKKYGGLILGASNAVQSEVPVANYLAVISACREHGRYA